MKNFNLIKSLIVISLFIPLQLSALDVDKGITDRCESRWKHKPNQVEYCLFLQRESFSYVSDWMDKYDLFNEKTENKTQKRIADKCLSPWKDNKMGPDWGHVHACIYLEESLEEEKEHERNRKRNDTTGKKLTMLAGVVSIKRNQRRLTK